MVGYNNKKCWPRDVRMRLMKHDGSTTFTKIVNKWNTALIGNLKHSSGSFFFPTFGWSQGYYDNLQAYHNELSSKVSHLAMENKKLNKEKIRNFHETS
ncbi:hypothetical protein TSUD_226080 [Trifolium subterraneum]|uniref:Uncharacterized protein n=1 Tax=Trifolium subterraneum TaxID=3900 RepID=A0A2Z6MRC1_TRISU|nr:hypothetical protein TSUD_226080 [Trifolium subterraneum]